VREEENSNAESRARPVLALKQWQIEILSGLPLATIESVPQEQVAFRFTRIFLE